MCVEPVPSAYADAASFPEAPKGIGHHDCALLAVSGYWPDRDERCAEVTGE